MKLLVFIASTLFLLSRCQQEDISANGTGIINQQFEISLHQSLVLRGSTGPDEGNRLGELAFPQLDESRCPASAICIRQGAAVTTFSLTTEPGSEPRTIRLFVGDFMSNDPLNKRSRTADTVSVQLANKAYYRLILKKVAPYPGTGTETPRATLLLERQ